MTELPEKDSDLIRLAVADLEKCEAMPDVYKVDMGDWHLPVWNLTVDEAPRCSVCLAGAVLAQTFEVPSNVPAVPGSRIGDTEIDGNETERLLQLDMYRRGIDDSLSKLVPRKRWIVPPYYRDAPAEFKLAMLRIADELEEEGR